MNLQELRYLVAVADHGHFGRAAAACYVSQPTLSTQLRKLERELGVELVERTPRGALLTATGERVVERARAVLNETDAIADIAAQSRDPGSGTVRIGLFPTLSSYLLPHVVPALHERFPHLDLRLVEEKTDDLLALLRQGRLDGVLAATPVDDGSLEHVEVLTERFLLAVPAGNPLATAGGPVDVAALADQPVLLLDEGHCLRDQALSVCRLVGASEQPGFRATSLETLRYMVASDAGVTLLPELAVRPPVPPSDDVVLLPFAEPSPHRDVALFWRRTSGQADLLRQVAAVIAEAVAPVLADPLPLTP